MEVEPDLDSVSPQLGGQTGDGQARSFTASPKSLQDLNLEGSDLAQVQPVLIGAQSGPSVGP